MGHDEANGLAFPEVDGSRATTPTATAIIGDAVAAADPGLRDDVAGGRDWRRDYLTAFGRLTALSANGADALAIARAGLTSMRERLVLGDVPLNGVKSRWAPPPTTELRGDGKRPAALRVPYRGAVLEGASLKDQLARWHAAGIVESGFGEAIEYVIDNPEALALPGRDVALLGAAGELSPLEPLAAWGATVLAIDVPVPAIGDRIARTASAGSGVVRVPADVETVGLDVCADPVRVADWVLSAAGERAELVLGMYAYADGGQHVLLSAAADVIGDRLRAARPRTALAWLGTPTDSYLVPEAVMAAARERYAGSGPVPRLGRGVAQVVTRGATFQPSYRSTYVDAAGNPWGVADMLLPMQGPNYALAKRLQRWRALVAADDGAPVSFNVAPAAWTRSVTRNRVFNVAYSGASRFGIEIFGVDTARWLMAAKLVADLTRGTTTRAHPEALMFDGANHGGFWRIAYDPKSVLGVAALAGLPMAAARALRSTVRP